MAIGVHHHPTAAAAAQDGGLWPAFVDTPASAKHRPRASEKENNGISSFYGSDDLTDMCDLLYKEDLFEHVRRATDTECFKNRKRSTGFLMSCFEFLKLFFSKS